MSDNQARLALWLAFTIESFTPEEVELIAVSLQTKSDEIRGIVDKNPIVKTKPNPYRDGDWFESCKPDDHD